MILPENRFPLFGILLWTDVRCGYRDAGDRIEKE